jgi:uncharacterized protein (UPF0548 family)
MLALRRPSAEAIQRFLDTQAALTFSYRAVGATRGDLFPPGYDLDHTRVRLGEGEADFSAACASLAHWDQFRLGWVEPWTFDRPIAVGATVGILARVCGMWSLNACRIVYTVDDLRSSRRRYGFAYGTLPDHAESGEERFLIDWDSKEGSVWYNILAFSRPRGVLARLGYPYARRVQRRFARESAAAMIGAVKHRRSGAGNPRSMNA